MYFTCTIERLQAHRVCQGQSVNGLIDDKSYQRRAEESLCSHERGIEEPAGGERRQGG